MLVSILMMGLLVLWEAPLFSYLRFKELYRWEENQIFTDNAAILVGKQDRELLTFIVKSNQMLNVWHHFHHIAHACALVPHTAPACKPKDFFLETQIPLLHQALFVRAQGGWKAGQLTLRTYLAANQILGRVDRLPALPLKSVTCPLCGLVKAWELDSSVSKLRTVIKLSARRPIQTVSEIVGRSLTETSRWQYRLRQTHEAP